jgi:hypothetical protein
MYIGSLSDFDFMSCRILTRDGGVRFAERQDTNKRRLWQGSVEVTEDFWITVQGAGQPQPATQSLSVV